MYIIHIDFTVGSRIISTPDWHWPKHAWKKKDYWNKLKNIWKILYFINVSMEPTKGSIIIGFIGTSNSGKDNNMNYFPVMLDMVKEQIWRGFGPFLYAVACKEPPSHSWVYAYQLPSSVQPTGFQLDWGPSPEMATAEHRFSHRTISVWILRYAFGHCFAGKPSLSHVVEATRLSAKMTWYLVESIIPLILTLDL